MNDVFPKFIIETDDQEGDCLIIAKCTYHKQLVTDKSKVKGGGWWKREGSQMILFGESHDFGPATIENIARCIQNKKVFGYASVRNISHEFIFKYKRQNGEIVDLQNYISEQN